MKLMSERLERGLQKMQDWLDLHKGIEIEYHVTHYMIVLTFADGDRIATTATGTTLEEAIKRIGDWSGSIP